MTLVIQDWLRGDIDDVIQVVPRQRARTTPEAAELDVQAGLGRWGVQLRHRRAAVMARRYLLVAVVLALVPALIALAVAASRPFWVLAVLVLAPVAAVLTLMRRTPDAGAARLLDRALGLHDQLSTALEIQARSGPSTGLAAIVVDEARVTLARSFTTARVRTRPARAEWIGIVIALCALAAVIAVPRHAHSGSVMGSSSQLASAADGVGSGAQRPGQTTRGHTTPASSTATTGTLAVQRVPLTGGAKAAYGAQASRAPGSRPPADVNGSATVLGQRTKPGLAISGGKGDGGSPKGADKTGARSGGGTVGAGASAKTGQSGAGTGSKATASSAAGARPKPSQTAKPSAHAATGAQGHGHGGTPAAGTAGSGKAAPNAKLGVTPYTTGGKKGLPLEASDTPTSAPRVSAKEGVSQQTNGTGGGGGGRSGHPSSGSTPNPGSGTDFSVIPPTSNASASPDQDLLQNYFGTANQLSFKGW